jgi:hypothetical protein
MPEITEVYEIVDRLTNRRAIEQVFLTAQEALNWLEIKPPKHHSNYRVQAVAVYKKWKPEGENLVVHELPGGGYSMQEKAVPGFRLSNSTTDPYTTYDVTQPEVDYYEKGKPKC